MFCTVNHETRVHSRYDVSEFETWNISWNHCNCKTDLSKEGVAFSSSFTPFSFLVIQHWSEDNWFIDCTSKVDFILDFLYWQKEEIYFRNVNIMWFLKYYLFHQKFPSFLQLMSEDLLCFLFTINENKITIHILFILLLLDINIKDITIKKWIENFNCH